MININLLRKSPEIIKKSLKLRNCDINIDDILDLDAKYREQLLTMQKLQQKRNELAKNLGKLKATQQAISKDDLQKANGLKKSLAEIEDSTNKLQQKLEFSLLTLPNILDSDVPSGQTENDNLLIKTYGEKRQFDFTPAAHDDIGEKMGLMDFTQATKVSGSRFVYLYGDLALLEQALINFMLDLHRNKFGYTQVSSPFLVNESSLIGTGQLPKFDGNNLYKTFDDKYLIPTAEVSLTNIVREKILQEDELPLRFVAVTPCFRREAGAAGMDTKGMIRQHQFTKIELVSITTPENSHLEHERKTKAAQEVLKLLELPYRLMQLCAGDTGATASKTYDLEVWIPSQNKYREISSCSNCLDYQARRMKTRFYQNNATKDQLQDKDKKYNSSKKIIAYPHTLNGSGLAVGRTIVAIMENYQEKNIDGTYTITIPKVLQPYLNNRKFLQGKSAKQ